MMLDQRRKRCSNFKPHWVKFSFSLGTVLHDEQYVHSHHLMILTQFTKLSCHDIKIVYIAVMSWHKNIYSMNMRDY